MYPYLLQNPLLQKLLQNPSRDNFFVLSIAYPKAPLHASGSHRCPQQCEGCFQARDEIWCTEAASPSWEGQWQKEQTSPTGDINTWAGPPQGQAQCTECWILRASLLWCINLEYRYWNLSFLLPVGRDYVENLLPLHQGRREAGLRWGNVSPMRSSPAALHFSWLMELSCLLGWASLNYTLLSSNVHQISSMSAWLPVPTSPRPAKRGSHICGLAQSKSGSTKFALSMG